MLSLLSDIRTGWTVLVTHWRGSALALLAIALGTGTNTAVFSLVRGVALQPLPYRDPDRLVMIWGQSKQATEPERIIATRGDVGIWRTRAHDFADLAALEMWENNPAAQMDLVTREGAERLRGAFVTPNFFELLGVQAAIGQSIALPADGDMVVLGHALWQRRFGADASLVGRELPLIAGRNRTSRPYRVMGILPPDVQVTYPQGTEIWVIRSWRETESAPKPALLYWVLARLRPDVPLGQAQRNMTALSQALERELPQETFRSRYTVRLEPVRDHVTGQIRPVLWLLSGMAGVVLLIACVDVASVLLARTTARARELAMRLALGATRPRLFRQMLVEGLVLCALGGAAGIGVAAITQGLVRRVMPSTMPRAEDVGVDWWVLAASIGVVAIAGLLASVMPSWRGIRQPFAHAWSEGSLSPTLITARRRWSRGLMATQVAVLCVLLVGALLLMHSLWNLRRVDLGFDPRVLALEMRLLGPKYRDDARLRQFQDEILTRVRDVPGVVQASMTSSVPLRGVDWTVVVTRGDAAVGGSSPRIPVNLRQIDWQYFSLMRIPLRHGRLFTAQDGAASAPVVIISESLATRLFPNESALGKSLATGVKGEIVGIVGDVRHVRVNEAPKPAAYVPRPQDPSELICVVARTSVESHTVVPQILAALQSSDPDQPIERVTTLDRVVTESIASQTFYTLAMALFGIESLLLAMIGTYGTCAQAVHERVREIGIRMAVGAKPADVMRQLVAEHLRPVLGGLLLGAIAAFWVARSMQSLFFGITFRDPVAHVASALLILFTSLVACYAPARRAGRLDPLAALRHS